MTEPMDARDVFRAAYENRYTWDHNFPGYTADVTLTQGEETFSGKVTVNPDLSVTVTEVADETAKRSILEQLREIAIHRIRRSFEDTHGKNTFTLGATDETGAVEVIVGGKSAGDRYKVRNNEVCHVHRHIHGVVVTIDTFSSHHTEAGYLSHRYDSVYHDASTNELKGSNDFEDHYTKVGDYYVLSQRVIRDRQHTATTTFSFSNISLLKVAVNC